MDYPQLVGIFASIGTGISLLPQFFMILKKKKSGTVSLVWLLILLAGLCLWVWYGFLKKDWIIILSNAFSVLVNCGICILMFLYRDKDSGE